MNWYLAKIVFRIICGDGNHSAQFDEQLRLVLAASREEAFIKAKALGKKEEDEFFNGKKQRVQWQFVNISELYLLNELTDGTELYSRIIEEENAENYMFTINQKAEGLEQTSVSQLINMA